MKRIFALVLVLVLLTLLAACGKVEITMQEIYDAGQVEGILQNHQSVSICNEMDGMVICEEYLTNEYAYEHYPDEEYDSAQFVTDEVMYAYIGGEYLRYLFIAPDGVTNDFSGDRALRYEAALTMSILEETIDSVSKKDGRITVKSVLSEEVLAALAEEGLISSKTEYVFDAKTREVISTVTDYTCEDGTAFYVAATVAYDMQAPEMIEVFLKYENQTEDLRNVTVVTNPGTEKEVSQTFRIPRGLGIGFSWADAHDDQVELYSDAACTEAYDAYANTDSDLTVYVKWAE